jgi:hypothetical protein
MKYACIILFVWPTTIAVAQTDTGASIHNDSWAVSPHKGFSALAKPAFGPYSVINVSSIDSAGFKRKRKDSSYTSLDISDEGFDIDNSQIMRIEKTKFYRIKLASGGDTSETDLAVASVEHNKKQTVLGKVLSKNDEGKNEMLDYKKDIYGFIHIADSLPAWKFYITDLVSYNVPPGINFTPKLSIDSAYVRSNGDSLFLKPNFNNTGFALFDQKDEEVAELLFNQKHPVIDILTHSSLRQQVIAAFFTVIISTKDYLK